MDDLKEDERLRLSFIYFGRDVKPADFTVFWNAVKRARQRSFNENSRGKRVTRATRVPGLTLSHHAYVARGLPPELAVLIERLAALGWSDVEPLVASPEVAESSMKMAEKMAARAELLRMSGAEVVLTVQPGYVRPDATLGSVPLYELDRRAVPPRSAGPVAVTDLTDVTAHATSTASRWIFKSAGQKRVREFAEQNLKWPGLLVRESGAQLCGVHGRPTSCRSPLAPSKVSKHISCDTPAEALVRRSSTASICNLTGPPSVSGEQLTVSERSPSLRSWAPRQPVPPAKRTEKARRRR